MAFKKGQSGNPSGRRPMAPELKEAIQQNGTLAIQRMGEMLADGRWETLEEKTQLRLLEVATRRAYGEGHVVEAAPDADTPTDFNNLSSLMRDVYTGMVKDGSMPELLNARPADTVDVTPKTNGVDHDE